MAMVYLDIETLSTGKEPSIDDRIITIGIGIDGVKKFWKEWDIGEKEVVKQFYDFLESLLKEQTVWIIGFNILKFDIPILIYKALKFNVRANSKVFELWYNCYVEDERQVLLLLNDFRFRGLSTKNIYKTLKELFREEIEKGRIRISEIRYKGSEISEFYNRRDYEKILSHLSSDLDFLTDLHYILKFRLDFMVSKKGEFRRMLCQNMM